MFESQISFGKRCGNVWQCDQPQSICKIKIASVVCQQDLIISGEPPYYSVAGLVRGRQAWSAAVRLNGMAKTQSNRTSRYESENTLAACSRKTCISEAWNTATLLPRSFCGALMCGRVTSWKYRRSCKQIKTKFTSRLSAYSAKD